MVSNCRAIPQPLPEAFVITLVPLASCLLSKLIFPHAVEGAGVCALVGAGAPGLGSQYNLTVVGFSAKKAKVIPYTALYT